VSKQYNYSAHEMDMVLLKKNIRLSLSKNWSNLLHFGP